MGCCMVFNGDFGNTAKKILEKFTKIKFEDEYFNTFDDYDLYLKNVYGDYMTPPPENKRGGHTDELGNIIFDLHKDYSECYSNLNHTSAAYTTPPVTGVLPLCTRLRRVRRNNPPWRSL